MLHISIFVFLPLLVSIHGEPPKIQRMSDVYMLRSPGDEVELYCLPDYTVPDTRPFTVSWLKETEDKTEYKPLDINNIHFEINTQKNGYMTVKDIQRIPEVEGKYKCVITNRLGESTTMETPREIVVRYIEPEYNFKPLQSYFYGTFDGTNQSTMAWANCGPPLGLPQPSVVWINGTSGLEIDKTDPRTFFQSFPINGNLYFQFRIYNATEYDTGNWSCRAIHPLAVMDAYFDVILFSAPPAPQNVSVNASYIKHMVVQWNFLRSDIKFYDIHIKNTATNITVVHEMTEYPSPVYFKTSFEFPKDLVNGQEYSIIIRATDRKLQVGAWSDPLVVTLPSELAPYILENLPQLIHIGETKELTLECKAEALPSPTLQWYFNDNEISQGSKYNIIGNTLRIKKMIHGTENSDGEYRCKATNKLGFILSTPSEVRVEWIDTKFDFPPQNKLFYSTSKEIRIASRSPLGYKLPSIKYKLRGVDITTLTHPNYGQGFYLDVSRKLTNALDIRTPNPLAEGEYQIIASNLGGETTATFFVTLAAAPEKIDVFEVKYAYGHAILLWEPSKSVNKIKKMGEIFKYRRDISTYVIEYSKEGDATPTKLETFGRIFDDKYIKREEILDNLEKDVDYQFRIKSIDLGKQESDWSENLIVNLPLKSPPHISAGPDLSMYYTPNLNRTIPCTTVSTPAASVSWFKNDQPVVAGEYIQIVGENLTLYNTNHDMHDGKYYCKATNTYGTTQSKTADVRIYYIMEDFLYTMPTVNVYDVPGYRDISILCRPPVSYPSASVYWSNGTTDFIKYSDQIYRTDNKVINETSFFSLTFRNGVQYNNSNIGCAAFNDIIGFNDNYKIAFTKIIFYGPPVWQSNVTLTSISPTSSRISWVKERDDIVMWEVTMLNGNTVKDKQEITDAIFAVFSDLSASLQYSFGVVMIDRAGQRSKVQYVIADSAQPLILTDLPAIAPLIPEGENTTLKCAFSGYPFPQIKWYKNSVILDVQDATNKQNYNLSSDNQTLTMVNTNRNIHDATYYCEAKNSEGEIKTRELKYRVTYFDKDFEFADSNKYYYNADGERFVSFECSPPKSYPFFVRDGTNVIWTKNKERIDNNALYKVKTVNKDGKLYDRIEFNATVDSNGSYTCMYRSMKIYREHSMDLNKFDGPLPPQNFELAPPVSWNFAELKWTPPAEVIDNYIMTVKLLGSTLNDPDRDITILANATSIKVRNLRASNLYDFIIVAVKDNKKSMERSNKIQTKPQPNIGKTGKPHNVQVVNIGLTDVTIKWEQPQNLANNLASELKYNLRVCTMMCDTYKDIVATQFKVLKLTAQTGYMFEVTVVNELNVESEKYEGTFTTLTSGVPPGMQNFKVLEKSWNFITVEWDDPSDKSKIREYILSSDPVVTKQQFMVDKKETKFTFTDLTEKSTYSLSLKAVNSELDGPISKITEKTDKLSTVPAVSNVNVELPIGYETERIILSWTIPTDIGNNLPANLKYVLSVCQNNNCQPEKEIAFTETSYIMIDLSPDSTYQVEITSIQADGNKGGVYTKVVKTAAANSKPSVPKSVKINKQASPTMLALSWDQPTELAGNDPATMKYVIDYCEIDRGTPKNCESKTVSQKTTAVLENLKPSTQYQIKVSALTSRNEKGESKMVFIQTDAVLVTTTTVSTQSTPTTIRPTSKVQETVGGDELSTGVLIAIIIAIIVILILLAAAVAVFIKSRRKKQNTFNRHSNRGGSHVIQMELNGKK